MDEAASHRLRLVRCRAGRPPSDSQQPQAVRAPQDDRDKGLPRPGPEDQTGHTHGQATEHEALWVSGLPPCGLSRSSAPSIFHRLAIMNPVLSGPVASFSVKYRGKTQSSLVLPLVDNRVYFTLSNNLFFTYK